MSLEYRPYKLSRIISVHELVSADYFCGLHPSTTPHQHSNAWELCVCLGGQFRIFKEDRYFTISAGELMFVHPRTVHDICSEFKGTEAFVISFTCNGDILHPLQDGVLSFQEDTEGILRKLIQELKSSFMQNRDELHLYSFEHTTDVAVGADQLICCYLEQFLIQVLRDVTMHKGKIVSASRFRDALQGVLIDQVGAYIRENKHRQITADEIAEHFHYSRSRLTVLFKELTGLGIREYVTYMRIAEAKTMLLEQKKSITQIAEELGFSSPQYFSRRFQMETGCTPSHYVEKIRSGG